MSIVGLILVAQAAAAPAAAGPLPDIELQARVEIRSLEIRSQGTARLALRAEPGDAPPVTIERSAPAGTNRYRNLRIELRGIARLTAPEPIAALDLTTAQTTTGDTE